MLRNLQMLPKEYYLVALNSVDSTNERAKILAGAGAGDRTLVWAMEQTAGRGRYGRTFVSPRGNLYLSIILRPRCTPMEALQFGFIAAVSLGDSLDRIAPPGVDMTGLRYKWPNDVLFRNRKISGILLESSTSIDGSLDWLVVGVGVNIVSHPDDTSTPAGDLREAGFDGVTEESLMIGYIGAFERLRRQWLADGFSGIRRAWLERAAGQGQVVTVSLGEKRDQGVFVDLDADGAMILQTEDGTRRRITVGDVFV
ncbi:MAG: biotin--[acetyl-CoA-carboxylase] ligase [Pseudomonadota bacterium]